MDSKVFQWGKSNRTKDGEYMKFYRIDYGKSRNNRKSEGFAKGTHKLRHPNDKNLPKKYSKQSAMVNTEVDMNMIRKVLQDSNRELYKELEIGSDCPKCDGSICYYGSTKHHPNHFRCNRGCVL